MTKLAQKQSIYVVCHTYAICCGYGDTIWLTAVWTTHKEDRSVPSHFHSWSKCPVYIFLQKWCVVTYCSLVTHNNNLKKAECGMIERNTKMVHYNRIKQDYRMTIWI